MAVSRGVWLASFLVALVALTGCSWRKGARDCNGPEWTCIGSGPCPLDGTEDNLCGVGIAENVTDYRLGMKAASERARLEIAKAIADRVTAFTKDVQDSLAKSGVGDDTIQQFAAASRTLTDQTLSGVMVPRTYYHPEHRRFFALAMVDAKTFQDAIKGLAENRDLSERVKEEIRERVKRVEQDWEQERARALQAK